MRVNEKYEYLSFAQKEYIKTLRHLHNIGKMSASNI